MPFHADFARFQGASGTEIPALGSCGGFWQNCSSKQPAEKGLFLVVFGNKFENNPVLRTKWKGSCTPGPAWLRSFDSRGDPFTHP